MNVFEIWERGKPTHRIETTGNIYEAFVEWMFDEYREYELVYKIMSVWSWDAVEWIPEGVDEVFEVEYVQGPQ